MLRNILWTAALTLAVICVLAAGLLLIGAEIKTLLRESGPVENVQALALLVGCLLFGFAAASAATTADRLLFAALALFYLTFMLREIEVEAFLADFPVLAVLDSPLRNYWVGALWAVLIVIVLRHLGSVLHAFFRWVRHLPGYLIIGGGVFYGLAEGIEKRALGVVPESVRAYEELPELVAVILMLFCAALTVRQERKRASDHPAQQPDAGQRGDRQADERHLDRRVQ